MKTILVIATIILSTALHAQERSHPPQTQIMTLGVFHFAYPNLDAIKTSEEDQISVLDEPFQSEIISIANAIASFHPTIIAVEQTPERQAAIDSLYALYKAGSLNLGKNEVHQLGFRIGKQLNHDRIYCVDDWGRHYDNVEAIFNDPERMQQLDAFYITQKDNIYNAPNPDLRVTSIIETLHAKNQPEYLAERLSVYLLNMFQYEEEPGDFTGVDFETGRWYNRNLRIFRNIQRIPKTSEDRILLIVGSEHLNLLNIFFDASREYELVSPLPWLDIAR